MIRWILSSVRHAVIFTLVLWIATILMAYALFVSKAPAPYDDETVIIPPSAFREIKP